jgi:hypothetical protein
MQQRFTFTLKRLDIQRLIFVLKLDFATIIIRKNLQIHVGSLPWHLRFVHDMLNTPITDRLSSKRPPLDSITNIIV